MDRRRFLAAGLGVAAPMPAPASTPLTRAVPKTGEPIAAVGMGTWLTFHVDVADAAAMAQRQAVLERFFASGGRLVDSSPMYASAERVLGTLLAERPAGAVPAQPFAAGKVWTAFDALGAAQMERSLALWKLPRFDLMQVHNLLNWRGHMKTLRAWKEQGRTRYLGVTTSHGNGHDEMRVVLQRESASLEFMQITYSPADRSAEPLIALAADRGLAVIVNRPFDGGALPARLSRRPLPGVAAELGCTSWAQLVLKWELAHPAVTCVIPATTNPEHAAQNVLAMHGPLPDPRLRARIGALIDAATA